MNVLIVSPRIYTYGALLIGGILKNEGYQVSIINEFNLQKASEADVVGLSFASTLNLLEAKGFVSRLQLGSNPPFIVLGGPVGLVPGLVFSHLPEIDSIVVGEGEETILELLQAFEDRPDLRKVSGISFIDGTDVIVTTKRDLVSLDGRPLPFITKDLPNQDVRSANTVIETHRGCFGNCTFCQVPNVFNHKIRSRPVEDIVSEVKWFSENNVSKIGMSLSTVSQYGWDGGLNEEAFINLLKEVSKVVQPQNLAVPDIRVDMISDEILKAIKNYTSGYVVFGIESGSDRMLKKMRKGVTVDKIIDACAQARKVGLKIVGSFVTGYPEETDEDHAMTTEIVRDLMLDDAWINIACPIPGTELGDRIVKMPLEENPSFIKDQSSIGRRHNLTVAEFRSLDLCLCAAAAAPTPFPLSDGLYDEFLRVVKLQHEEVVLCTNIVRRFYLEGY